MGEWGVMILDSQLWEKISEQVVVKLFSAIWDQDSRDPIPADDVPPNKALYVLLCDGG